MLCALLFICSCVFLSEILIPRMGHLNTPDRNGKTCLHHAAYNGHAEVSVVTVVCTVFGYDQIQLMSRGGGRSFKYHYEYFSGAETVSYLFWYCPLACLGARQAICPNTFVVEINVHNFCLYKDILISLMYYFEHCAMWRVCLRNVWKVSHHFRWCHCCWWREPMWRLRIGGKGYHCTLLLIWVCYHDH